MTQPATKKTTVPLDLVEDTVFKDVPTKPRATTRTALTRVSATSTEQTTSGQQSLALFDELFASDTPITGSPLDIGFRRNSLFVDVVDLGIVARRAVDAAYFIASQDPEIQTSYEVDLSYFKWLMMYTSGNRTHLRAVFRAGQKAALECDASTTETEKWGALALLGLVVISDSKLTFEIDARLQKLIKDPVQSHFFSLRVSNLFTSTYAKPLYDHLLVYSSVGMTEWLPLEVVRDWLDARAKSMAEFRYFKRAGLEPAVKQINELTDLQVSYITNHEPGSKRINKVRFIVKMKENIVPPRLALLGSKELYDMLRGEFGLSPVNMEEILENRTNWSNDRIHQAIDFVRYSIERKKVTKSVSGFFMKALRDNLLVSSSDLKVVAQLAEQAEAEQESLKRLAEACNGVKVATSAAREKAMMTLLAEGQRGLIHFMKLQTGPRDEILSEFTRTQSAKLLAKRMKVDLGDGTSDAWLEVEQLATLFGQFVLQKLSKPKLC